MPDYSLAELAALSGLPPRTIRYYVAEGLLPSPGREGPGTRYPESTLARLRLIARLRDAHQPLAEIRTRLASLGDAELTALLGAPAAPAPPENTAIDYIRKVLGHQTPAIAAEAPQALYSAAAPPPAAPLPAPMARSFVPPAAVPASPMRPAAALPPTAPVPTGERSQWDRISLGEGIELHVRRPLSRRDNRMVDRLVAFARQLQREDPL